MIYSGEVENWKAFGGKDMLIRAVMREPGDSTLSVLEKNSPVFKGITCSDKLTMAFSTPETFKLLSTRKGAVGYGAYDVATSYADDVVALRVDGKLPSNAGYPLPQTVGLVFKEENRKAWVRDFVEFATSPAAHAVIVKAGGIPLQ